LDVRLIVSLRFAAGAESKGRARRGAVAFGEVANGNEVVVDLGLGGLDDPLSAGNLRGLSVTSCCKVAVFTKGRLGRVRWLQKLRLPVMA
jgi:hypothetical protein